MFQLIRIAILRETVLTKEHLMFIVYGDVQLVWNKYVLMNIYVYLLQRRCIVSNMRTWTNAMGLAFLLLLEIAFLNIVNDGYWLFTNILEMMSS